MKIIKNTYPAHPGVAHAKAGDEVRWEFHNSLLLIRKSDKKIVFSTAKVGPDGLLRSNKKQPVLAGIIAQVKSKGWILEVGE